MKPNKVFEALLESPCTAKEMPYKAHKDYELAVLTEKIKVIGGKRAGKRLAVGRFLTVYYLTGDVKRAAAKFVEVNAEPLSCIDFSRNNIVSSVLSGTVLTEIKAAMVRGENATKKMRDL